MPADARNWPQLPAGAHIVEHGDHGPAIEGLTDHWRDAVSWLSEAQTGDARGVLRHRDIPGRIDLIWGAHNTTTGVGYGLAHIAALHPEVLDDLPERLDRMRIYHVAQGGRPGERIVLKSPQETAIIRTNFDGERKYWLLSAYTSESGRRGRGTTGSPTGLPGPTRSSGLPDAATNIGVVSHEVEPLVSTKFLERIPMRWNRLLSLVPAKAGTSVFPVRLDSRFRGD